jgi:hypothetical protein
MNKKSFAPKSSLDYMSLEKGHTRTQNDKAGRITQAIDLDQTDN